MKLAAIVVLMLSTTGTGILLSERARRSAELCSELVKLCDLLALDIGFRNTPIPELVESFSFKQLYFIGIENIKSKQEIKTPLTAAENNEISVFLYSLGKSGPVSQRMLIEGFKQYARQLEMKYKEAYAKNARLYLSFGFFGGAIITLAVI